MSVKLKASREPFDALMEIIKREYPDIVPFIEVRELKDGNARSVFLYQQRAFLCETARGTAYMRIFDDYLVEASQGISPSSLAMADGSVRIPLDISFNQKAFLLFFGKMAAGKRSTANVERFGCCDRYITCSDAKECLSKNEFYSLGCYYRTNLERGRIFYGKNRNDISE